MDYIRIKFYSKTDMSVGYYLEKVEKVLDDFDEEKESYDINQIIEFYNINCYLDEYLPLEIWPAEQKNAYELRGKVLKKHVGVYFAEINEDNLCDIYSEIDFQYNEDFWLLFERYRVYKRISGRSFEDLLANQQVGIHNVLHCKAIVENYESEIVKYLMDNCKSAELLLREYAEDDKQGRKKYYFPKKLDESKKVEIISNYIESESANPNYLELIYKSQRTLELPLTDKIKLGATRKYEKKMEEVFQQTTMFKYKTGVSFCESQEEVVKLDINSTDVIVSYSREWIDENQEYATLLNNFIYLFEYTDMQFRIQHVRKISQMGVFERMLGVKGKKEYLKGIAFNQLQGLAKLQMLSYVRELKRIGIRIEEVIEWFFHDYLKEEFGISDFYIKMPSVESEFIEKCRTIISETDSILKQFRLYVEDGEIDKELLQISSVHIFFKDVPSLIGNKYIYGKGEEYSLASYYLFSDQSPLDYIAKYGEKNNLPHLLLSENVELEEFITYQRQGIDWLVERDYIGINGEGFLKLNEVKVIILGELFKNEVLCSSYSDLLKYQLEELQGRNVIEYEETLFSRPEQDYFNYLLNKSEFSNGLDLRNRYIHGTQSSDEKVHAEDYYTFLRILILIIIKINEEFCLRMEADE